MSDVFISYSRRDIELVSRLCDGLRGRGKTVFVDLGERLGQFARVPAAAEPAAAEPAATGQAPSAAASTSGPGPVAADLAAERARAEISGIPPSARWMYELHGAIAAADNIAVVISPASCASPVCRTELDYAVGLNKRLVPVVAEETDAALVPPALASLNWLTVNPGPSFDGDVDRLVDALDTDVEGLHPG